MIAFLPDSGGRGAQIKEGRAGQAQGEGEEGGLGAGQQEQAAVAARARRDQRRGVPGILQVAHQRLGGAPGLRLPTQLTQPTHVSASRVRSARTSTALQLWLNAGPVLLCSEHGNAGMRQCAGHGRSVQYHIQGHALSHTMLCWMASKDLNK